MQNHVKKFIEIGGQLPARGEFNTRQVALYIGLQLEEMAELIGAVSKPKAGESGAISTTLALLESTLNDASHRFKGGAHDKMVAGADKAEVLDACIDAANALTELEQQIIERNRRIDELALIRCVIEQQVLERNARVKELEDALRTVGDINYDAARVRLSAVVDKALSNTTPSEALQRALLENGIEILDRFLPATPHAGFVTLANIRADQEELRAQLAALGE